MKTTILIAALLGAASLAACERREVVAVPVPATTTTTVPVPGPAGPKGDAGKPGDTTVIVTPPAAPASAASN